MKIEVISANFSSAWGFSVSSIWARERVLSSSSSSRLRLRAALDHVLVVFVGVGLGLVVDLFLFLDRGAGDLLADLAFGAFAAFLGLVELLGGRALRQHGFEVDDLAQLHAPLVEGVGPADDGVEGDRAFAQAPDHGVAAGLDALGDGDLALAARGAQRRPSRAGTCGPGRRCGRSALSWSPRRGGGRRRRADRPRPRSGLGLLVLFVVVRILGILDDVDARSVKRDMMSSISS